MELAAIQQMAATGTIGQEFNFCVKTYRYHLWVFVFFEIHKRIDAGFTFIKNISMLIAKKALRTRRIPYGYEQVSFP